MLNQVLLNLLRRIAGSLLSGGGLNQGEMEALEALRAQGSGTDDIICRQALEAQALGENVPQDVIDRFCGSETFGLEVNVVGSSLPFGRDCRNQFDFGLTDC